MKKIALLFILIICTSSLLLSQDKSNTRSSITLKSERLNAEEGLVTEKKGNHIYKGYLDEKGKRVGCWRRYNHQNLLKAISEYKDGRKNGVHVEIDAQGNLEKEQTYKDDKLHGESNTYLRGNYVIESISYYEGILHGKYIKHYKNKPKVVMEESNYNMGKKDGISKWYTEDGNLLAEYTYVNGEFNGVNKTYHSNGKIKIEEEYKDNIPIGTYKEYHEDGKTLKLTGEYKDGLRDGKWYEYDAQGKVINKMRYRKGELK